MRFGRLLAVAAVLAVGMVAAPFAPSVADAECGCADLQRQPWSGPPDNEPAAGVCEDLPATAFACVNVWADDGHLPDAEVCVGDQFDAVCVWTTAEEDGESGGVFDDDEADDGDLGEAGVCVDDGADDPPQEPDVCVNEYGDPDCQDEYGNGNDWAYCDPATDDPNLDPCPLGSGGPQQDPPECDENQYDPQRCVYWVPGTSLCATD